MHPSPSRSHRRRSVLTAFTLAVAIGGLAVAGPVMAADPAIAAPAANSVVDGQISRSEVLVRSQSWIDQRVPYSQSVSWTNQYGTYRQDCSGYVSMAWHLGFSRSTATLPAVMHSIAKADLRPGDALWRQGHIALFIRWNDAARTSPVVREEYDYGHNAVERTWSANYTNSFSPVRYNKIVEDGPTPPNSMKVTRYGFSNTAGLIFAKDERDGSWQTLNGGGASHWVFDGDRIGAIIGGNFLLKEGLFGGWRVMAGGGDVKKIALSGGRVAFSNGAGIIHAKDQLDGQWHVLNPDGRAGQWILDHDRIGAILDGNFLMKEGLDDPWLAMAGGGDVKTIGLHNGRIAFSNGAGIIYAKDDRDGGWHTMNPGGHASQWTLEGNRIGALVNGDFLFKDNIHAPWLTMAGGGDVRQIQLNGNRIAFSNSAGIIYAKDDPTGAWHELNPGNRASEWQLEGTNIGALVNGNFLVKNGLDAPWITMTGSGDAQHIQNHDRMIQIG